MVPKPPKPSSISDCMLFFSGAFLSLFLFLCFSSFLSQSPSPSPSPSSTHLPATTAQSLTHPPTQNIYDDPSLSYTVTDTPIKNWDLKRQQWLSTHPTENNNNKILMLSGSQPSPCRNPIGDHLLLRFLKNKVDYCRLHSIPLFYNNALLQPSMFSFWAKIPVIRSAMIAHPEAQWFWWVDSDAAFTDMEFELPLDKYRNYNLVAHGWPKRIYGAHSWTGLNAGVLLIRNCQWSIDFIDRWAKMGPQSPEYDAWGRVQTSMFKDKVFKESDDQTGIAYLLVKEKDKWADKVYLEHEFYFESYWEDVVNTLDEIGAKRRVMDLRRRAEKERMVGAGAKIQRPPFITHFTGCQPCSGNHNKNYSEANCYEAMHKALNFADDQVLRFYGFRHERSVNSTGVTPLTFHFPAPGG